MGVGQFYEDQYEEEYVGYPITSVSNLSPVLSVIQSTKASGELSLSPLLSFPDFSLVSLMMFGGGPDLFYAWSNTCHTHINPISKAYKSEKRKG